MKNLFFFWLLVNSSLCISQTTEEVHIELTPIVGYSSSQHLHSSFLSSSTVSGIQLGAYGNYFFNNRWSLRSGLLYQKMGTDKFDLTIISDDYSERTNYLTLPFSINYHFGAKRKWFINYGISIGILINAEADYEDGNGFVDIKDLANPIQFGMSGGIGYKFEISPDIIVIIDNYNMIGLTDTTKERSGKNFYMSLNLGMVFKI